MATEKKRDRRLWLALAALALLVVVPVLCGLILSLSEGPSVAEGIETRDAARATADEVDEVNDRPTPTRAFVSLPTPTYDSYDRLVVGIDAGLGELNRGNGRRKMTDINYREDEGSISVTWAADDHFSNSLIVTSIQSDAAAVLRAIDESGVEYERVFLAATFALQDASGNASESEVMLASYDRETIERINWGSFLATEVFDIAMNYQVSPVLSD